MWSLPLLISTLLPTDIDIHFINIYFTLRLCYTKFEIRISKGAKDMDVYFVSSNKYKISEVQTILSSTDIRIHAVSEKINEIQSTDMKEIALHKAVKAFQKIGRPILVEQTGLLIKDFGNLPGGLTQIFWASLKADKFSDIFSKIGSAEVTAKTVLAFCDGKRIHTFEGEVDGHIVCPPRGSSDFQWDCVFEPLGYNKTFAELGEQKNEISMRKIAVEKFRTYVEANK